MDIYLSPSESKNGLWTSSWYANDVWQLNKRLTINAGLRFDRHSAYLPDQKGPGGQSFSRVNNIVDFNNWGPRLGVSFDLTGDGKTVAKASYGQFWLYPAADLSSGLNPNATMWFNRYSWADGNGNKVFDPGEQGALLSVQGGRASTTFDPNLENTYVRQATVYVEREIVNNFGVRTGFVWNGRRQVRGQITVNRPLSAYTVPISIRDPGPDGRLNTADDGNTFTAYNLDAATLAQTIVNTTTNLPEANSDYYTWELTATKREARRWSMLASVAYTRRAEAALGAGAAYTPNNLINTDGGRAKSTVWQGKILATLHLPGAFNITPTVRNQAGTPFGRTFTQALNWGNATIRAEPVDAHRMPNITVFDLRTEKSMSASRGRVTGFFDIYNIFNTNAEQDLAFTSGASYLRPVAITSPRIARLGIKFVW